MVTARGLVHAYGERRAVDGVDLDLVAGERVALAGANVLVAGSTVYSASNPPAEQVKALVDLISTGLAESRNFA